MAEDLTSDVFGGEEVGNIEAPPLPPEIPIITELPPPLETPAPPPPPELPVEIPLPPPEISVPPITVTLPPETPSGTLPPFTPPVGPTVSTTEGPTIPPAPPTPLPTVPPITVHVPIQSPRPGRTPGTITVTLPPVAVPPAPTPTTVPPFITYPPVGGPTLGQTTPIPITVIPPVLGGFLPTVGTFTGEGEGPITVIVNNLESIGEDVVSSISYAIEQGLAAEEANFAASEQSLFGGIIDAIKTLASNIGTILEQAIEAIASHIGDILKAVGQGIAQLAKDILGVLRQVLQGIGSAIQSLAKFIVDNVVPVLNSIATWLNKYIVPLTQAITRTLNIVGNLIRVIQQDLHNGIRGILAIPGQISDALNGLDATFYRLWQQVRPEQQTDARSNIQYGVGQLSTALGAALSGALKGITSTASANRPTGGAGTLSDPSIGTIGGDVVQCLATIAQQSLNTWQATLTQYITPGEISEDAIAGFIQYTIQEFFNLLVGLLSVFGVAYPMIDFARQQANKCIPVTTLAPAEMVEAQLRGFVDQPTYNEELRRQGIDATRSTLLTKLATHRFDESTLADLFRRGTISDSDYNNGLASLGFTENQVAAQKATVTRLATVDEVLLWLRRGLIGPDDATSIIKKLGYTDDQASAILSTYRVAVPVQFRANIDGLLNASGMGWLTDSLSTQPPQEVIDAGVRDGLEADYVKLLWLNHFSLPPYTQIVQSYFRGLRTYTEVVAAMISQNIPREIHDELIQNARPLIPYRSIPSFVKAGAMSSADAVQELTRHGFDQQHIVWISNLLGATKSTVASSAAATNHSVSVGTAKSLFADGAITKDQFISVLEQHGYTPALATTTADVLELADHVKERKQLIADTLAEVSAGVVSLDSGTSTLAGFGATAAEIAKFHLAAAKALRVAAKHPSIAELDRFAKAQLITQSQYTQELSTQGWSPQWVEAFAKLLYASPTQQYPA